MKTRFTKILLSCFILVSCITLFLFQVPIEGKKGIKKETVKTVKNTKKESKKTEEISVTPSETIILKESSSTPPLILTEHVPYQNNPEVIGYLARPNTENAKPTLILIHEWWGLNTNIKQIADTFAKNGYVALAVDLYNGQAANTPVLAQGLAKHVRDNMDDAFQNLNSAITYLKDQAFVDSKRIGSIGWCFGGGWSYQMAKNNLGTKVSIIYYGQFNPKDDLKKMKAKIQGHFGGKDQHIKIDTVKEFQANLKSLRGNHEIYIYPNSDHAFANDIGANYNKKDADVAWKRTLAFLKRYL